MGKAPERLRLGFITQEASIYTHKTPKAVSAPGGGPRHRVFLRSAAAAVAAGAAWGVRVSHGLRPQGPESHSHSSQEEYTLLHFEIAGRFILASLCIRLWLLDLDLLTWQCNLAGFLDFGTALPSWPAMM